MSHHMFLARRAAWCEATGLRPSRARTTSALRWLPESPRPYGFDRTGVYYYPPKNLHILITEPYHSTADALVSLTFLSQQCGAKFSYAVGQRGAGLWYPGHCFALLCAVDWADELLAEFAAALPTDTEEAELRK